jgi:hypothetical protein
MSQLIAQHLTDLRGTNTRLPLADLLRQSVYRRLAGYEDVSEFPKPTKGLPPNCGLISIGQE